MVSFWVSGWMASSLLYFLGWLLGVIHARTSSTVDHSIINENVLFYKDGEMSLSSSRWILTLVLDINVYDNFITQLTADIKNAMDGWMFELFIDAQP